MKYLFSLVLVWGISCFGHVHADTRIDDLTKRIEELEFQQQQMLLAAEEPRPKVYSFLNNNLTLGGFFEPGYTVLAGEDTDTQAATSNTLALNIATNFKSNYRFVSQFISVLGLGLDNPHNNPTAASATFPSDREFNTVTLASTLTQGYIEYSFGRSLNLQGGLGYVPFGYYLQQREMVLFWRRGGPQLLRSSQLILPFWTGIHAHGSFTSGVNSMGYNAYTFSPGRNMKGIGVGSRGWWASEDEALVVGLSAQVAKGVDETYELLGTDFKIEAGSMVLRTEFIQQLTLGNDPWSAYIEPGIYGHNERVLYFVYADYVNNPLNTTTPAIADPIQKWEYGAGINFLPTSFTRFRFSVTYNDYVGSRNIINDQNRDFWSYDISAGVSF